MPFEPMTMSDGAVINVYRAVPTGERKGGLVLIQEIFGVTAHIREVCDGYAADGYEVLAPAIFDREAPGFEVGYESEDWQQGFKLATELHPFDLSIADTQTCIDALKGPVFITGYCYGGTVAFVAAARCTGLAAASGYYGGFIIKFNDEKPKVPTILHFGQKDDHIPMSDVEAIAAAHPDVAVHVYDAGHGFNSDRRADYDEASAKLARDRTLALFAAHAA